jgi:enamine deaminase RidA (YjgF/YER057c/UK114 family)
MQSSLRMSRAVVHGNTLHVAGQVAQDPVVGIVGQTREVLAAIKELS